LWLQLLQEELSGSYQTQADFIQLGQSIIAAAVADTQLEAPVGERVARQMSEVRDTADRLQSTLSELESSLASLVDTTRRFDDDLVTVLTSVTSLSEQLSQLPAAVGFQSTWFSEQNLLVRVRACCYLVISKLISTVKPWNLLIEQVIMFPSVKSF